MPKLGLREEILEKLREPMFTREEILEKWREELDEGIPIIYAGCSAGYVARAAEKAGMDAIVTYETGLSRHWGMPTSMLHDPNTLTFQMFDEIKNVVDHTPIVAGLEAYDPKYLGEKGTRALVRKTLSIGFDGIQNFPTLVFLPDTAKLRDTRGVGFERELDLVTLCKKLGIFNMWYACNPEQATAVVKAGTDVVVPHCGWTHGGVTGAPLTKRYERTQITPVAEYKAAAEWVQKIIDAGKKVNKDIINLSHGGPWGTPKDVKYLFEHTDSDGFEAASAFERIPSERAIIDTVKKFKKITLRRYKGK